MTLKRFSDEHYARLSGSLILLAGASLLVTVAIQRFASERYEHYLIFDLDSRAVTALIGLLLIYLSIHIIARRRVAYKVALVISGLALVSELINNANLITTLAVFLTVVVLVVGRKTFTVSSDTVSLRRGVFLALFILVVTFVYATVGFYKLEAKAYRIDFTLAQSMQSAVQNLFFLQSDAAVPVTRSGRAFQTSVKILGTGAFILAAFSFFRPLRFNLANQSKGSRLAESILKNSQTTAGPEDYFKIWPEDKHYFFSQTKDSFIAYTVKNNIALALNGPSGKFQEQSEIVAAFTLFCTNNGWQPVFIQADEPALQEMEKSGYETIFIGNEAMVDCATFATTTYRSKHFRYVTNKSRREGLEVVKWTAPLTDSQLNSLRRVSDEWMTKDGRREYTFVMGYFDDDYLRRCDCLVVTHNGQELAYVNIIPTYNNSVRSIDHIRHRQDVPQTTIHFLLLQTILAAHEQDVKLFNLGLAPLSGLEQRTEKRLPEKLLVVLKSFGGGYYSFQGIEQFKNKFEPNWQPRFICFRGSSVKLVAIARALEAASSYDKAKRSKIRLLSFIAAISYASYPLATLLNPDAFLSSYASVLAKPGQPFWYIFKFFDIVAGVGILAIAVWLRKPRAYSRLFKNTFYILGSAILTGALFPVRDTPMTPTILNLITPHSIASAIVASCIAWLALTMIVISKTNRSKAKFVYIGIGSLYGLSLLLSMPDWSGQFIAQYVSITFTGIIIYAMTDLMIKQKAIRNKSAKS